MKKFAGVTLAVLMSAGWTFAQTPQAQQPGEQQQPAQPGMGSQDPAAGHAKDADRAKDTDKAKSKDKSEFSAQVVSVDATAKTITLKKADTTTTGTAEPMTMSVDASAQGMLSKLSAGDRVKVACKA